MPTPTTTPPQRQYAADGKPIADLDAILRNIEKDTRRARELAENARVRSLRNMTEVERVTAMFRRQLTGLPLRQWATSFPHEIPATSLATGPIDAPYSDDVDGLVAFSAGEYPWILEKTPEFCEGER